LIFGLAMLCGCSSPEFEHRQALSVRGQDGVTYALTIFWNDSPTTDGDHAIRVVTVSPNKHSTMQDFTSGNRTGLRTVSVQPAPGHDLVLFRCESYFAGHDLSTYTNTVDATGLHGYPEWVTQRKLRAAEAAAALVKDSKNRAREVP